VSNAISGFEARDHRPVERIGDLEPLTTDHNGDGHVITA